MYLKVVFIIFPKTRQIKYLYFLHNPELLPTGDCTVYLEHPSDRVHLLKIRTHKILLIITAQAHIYTNEHGSLVLGKIF